MKRLARVLRRLTGTAPPPIPPAATGPIEVTSRHLTPAVAAAVEAWFRGEISDFALSGDRSVVLAHPENPALRLKIKGAGLRGQALTFNRRHKSGLRAPRFDFEGRMMEDVAAGHDNTWFGGASFQQTAVEYAVSQRLNGLGFATVPCLGHGQVTREGRASWFSVFEHDPALRSYTVPDFTIQQYAAQSTVYGAQVVELASHHGLVGYFWYVAEPPGGPLLIKDVHPFYSADPIDMSQLSWVMQVLYAIHIVALTTLLVRKLAEDPDRPADAQAYAFRSFCPDASADDHQALRMSVIGPYMRAAPAGFDPRTLHALLKSNRISAALMERCPPEFARF